MRLTIENIAVLKTASSEKVALVKKYNCFEKVGILKKEKLWKSNLLKKTLHQNVIVPQCFA